MRWSVRGDAPLFERERPRLRGLAHAGRPALELRLDLSPPLYLKASALRGRAALRHALRRALGAELPRLAELRNLAWLRAQGFDAPRPVLAGAAWSAGRPRFQFLYTEAVQGAETLSRLLEEGGARAEAAALAVARVAARLHARGFVHRDLFARNVLVGDDARVHLLDAWRSGPARPLRGPAYDLGCFLHDLAAHGAEGLEPRVRAAYAAERARLGDPLAEGPFGRAVSRARAGRASRDARARRKRSSGAPPA
jgi:tRNA A-37 threonylcarbamoyl transferase component Bud32